MTTANRPTGKMIGPLVGYTDVSADATMVESRATPRGPLELWNGNSIVPGFEPRWYVVGQTASGRFVGASTEFTCRKVYEATR